LSLLFAGYSSEWHEEIAANGVLYWIGQHLLSFRGLDGLVHADTMLFILGLTFFVSVIAQTRLLEGITFFLLRRNHGAVLPTVIAVTAIVAFAELAVGITDKQHPQYLQSSSRPSLVQRFQSRPSASY
jgi:hypothetical protein